MIKFVPHLCLLLLLSLWPGCRNDSGAKLWTSLGHQADALNDSLELLLKSRHLYPSSAGRFITALDSIAGGDKAIDARVEYWKAALLALNAETNEEEYLAGQQIGHALRLTSGLGDRYLTSRLHILRSADDIPQPQLLTESVDAANLFKSLGDSSNYAIALSRMSFVLYDIGDTALYPRIEAERERLFRSIGAEFGLFDCMYNRLTNNYLYPAVIPGGEALADSLTKMPTFERSWAQRSIIYLYLYETTADPKWLHLAYDTADPIDDAGGTLTMAAGHKALYFQNIGHQDSAMHYFDIFVDGLAEPIGERVRTYNIARKVYQAFGDTTEAKHMALLADHERRTVRLVENSASVTAALASSIDRMLDDKSSKRHNLTYWGLSIAIVVSLVLLFLLKRRRTEATTQKMPDSPELIAQAIKADCNSSMNWNDVDRAFSQHAPMFSINLRAKFPGLSPAELRTAQATVIGLDTKTIATMLNISPDSVKKAKMRLRIRLSLPPRSNNREYLLPFLSNN